MFICASLNLLLAVLRRKRDFSSTQAERTKKSKKSSSKNYIPQLLNSNVSQIWCDMRACLCVALCFWWYSTDFRTPLTHSTLAWVCPLKKSRAAAKEYNMYMFVLLSTPFKGNLSNKNTRKTHHNNKIQKPEIQPGKQAAASSLF